MTSRCFDEEFPAGILDMLKKRDILGRANATQLVPLWYNAYTKADAMEQRFQQERRQNPLLETTPPEAWLTAELMPVVQEIRAQVDIGELILDSALQRYLRSAVHPIAVDKTPDEQQLCTSVEAYLPAVKDLLINLYDRRKSLRAILQIPRTAYTFYKALTTRKPTSRKEAIFLEGINAGWKNPQIARTLDEDHQKPRTYESYRKMLRSNPQNFYSLKNGIKKKYLDSVSPSNPISNRISRGKI